MDSVEIEIGEEIGRFKSHAEWVNHAPWVYQAAYNKIGSKDVITLDSATPRRVMIRGAQFNRAEIELTFPVMIYALEKREEEEDSDYIDPRHICPYCGQDSCDCDML